MWYVVQVRAGTEEGIRTQCRKTISPAVLTRCLIPYYEEKKRIRGEWVMRKSILFPGYLFVETDCIGKFCAQLSAVTGLARVLGSEGEAIPLRKEELVFLQCFGGETQTVAMSEGILEGSRIRVCSGPLTGREALICRIDRHKRRAWLELELFGRMQKIQVGLEIIAKTVCKEPPVYTGNSISGHTPKEGETR